MRCHTSSLHSRWQTSPTLLGATARSCREQCRQTRAGSQIVHHTTKSGLGATVSKLVPGICRLFEAGACFFLSSSFLAAHTWGLIRWLAGCSVYRREHVLPRRVNCSGEDRKLSGSSVILSGTSAAVPDEFQGRRKFSNNAPHATPLLQYTRLHITCPFLL